MTDDRSRSVWNVVALIATLGLSAVVAVVAVSRSDRGVALPTPSPSSSPSPTPSPTGPASLAGKGPYVVYALASGDVLAYDIAAAQWVTLGRIDAAPVPQHTAQPGSGDVVAFATDGGTVWRVGRQGLKRVAILPVTDGRLLEGGVVSRDGRRFAVASTGADPELLVVNIANGKTSAFERKGGSNKYPHEPLVPAAWSLGGSLVYQIPVCDCDTLSDGLYVFDLDAGRSSVVTATSQDAFFDRFAISPDGQQLVWGGSGEESCSDDPESTCPAPPFTLRRLAAGRRTSSVIRRESKLRFADVVWSADGQSLLSVLIDDDTRTVSYELAEPESGDLLRSVRGVPSAASILAVLRDRTLVVDVGAPAALQLVKDGKTSMVAEAADGPVFLGWLR